MARGTAVAMTALLLWPVAAAYAENALPGSTAWWVKRRIEDARLVVALDRQTEIRLQLDFARRRLNEVSELVARGELSHATPALGDYQRRVSIVREFIPDLNTGPADDALQQRIESDLTDYVATLARQSTGACGGTGSKLSCRELDDSAKRSRDALDRVASIPKQATVKTIGDDPHPGASKTKASFERAPKMETGSRDKPPR